MKKILLIISLGHTVLFCVPGRFDRLFLMGPDGSLRKTVDLIGDGHDILLELAKVPEVSAKGFAVGKEQVLSLAERTFMQVVRDMAGEARPRPIDVLWEISAEQYQFNGAAKDFLTGSFIEVAGKQLQKELSGQSSSLRIIDTDTYRTDALKEVFNPELQSNPKIYGKKVAKVGKALFGLLGTSSKVDADLQKLQAKDSQAYQKINSLWDTTKANMKKYLDEYIMPYLMQKRRDPLTLLGLQQALKKDKNLDDEKLIELLEDFDDEHAKLMDIEILINIFLSDAEHIIVYAGLFHTSSVAELLVKEFGYKQAFTLGYKFDDFRTMDPSKMFQLNPGAWDFLKQNPQESFSVYQSKGYFDKAVGDDYYQELEDILARKPDARLKAMDEWLKEGGAHYLDAANTRIEQDKPLLAKAVELNDVSLARLLIEHGASLTALYRDEKKKEYVSVFALAQEMQNEEMIQLLKKFAAAPSEPKKPEGVEIPSQELQRYLLTLELELQALQEMARA